MRPHERIIVALDVETSGQAIDLISALRGEVGMFKIGKRLFTAEGPDLVSKITRSGYKVFLDLKYHDIPNTVADACVEAVILGASIINMHACGGRKMMTMAREAVWRHCESNRMKAPLLIGVTVLTSHDDESMNETGVPGTVLDQVINLAQLSRECHLDGVVASPKELGEIRRHVGPSGEFIVVTPGIRPAGDDVNDQKRVTTPYDAIRMGADYIVVGRPIIGKDDPAQAARAIAREIETATN